MCVRGEAVGRCDNDWNERRGVRAGYEKTIEGDEDDRMERGGMDKWTAGCKTLTVVRMYCAYCTYIDCNKFKDRGSRGCFHFILVVSTASNAERTSVYV